MGLDSFKHNSEINEQRRLEKIREDKIKDYLEKYFYVDGLAKIKLEESLIKSQINIDKLNLGVYDSLINEMIERIEQRVKVNKNYTPEIDTEKIREQEKNEHVNSSTNNQTSITLTEEERKEEFEIAKQEAISSLDDTIKRLESQRNSLMSRRSERIGKGRLGR